MTVPAPAGLETHAPETPAIRAACQRLGESPESAFCLYPKCDCKKVPAAARAALAAMPDGRDAALDGAIKLDMRDIFVTEDEAISLRHLAESMAKQHGTRVNISMFQETANALCMIIERALKAQPASGGWMPIETAPKDGRLALVYSPLAESSGDRPVDIKRLIGGRGHCWPSTVPEGQTPTNPTDGACHVTHWQPLPSPPSQGSGE